MSQSITCPSCQTEIELSGVLRSQIESQVRGELAEQAREQHAALDATRQKLELERERLKSAEQSLQHRVQLEIESQRQTLLVEARKQAAENLSVELADQASQLDELKDQLAQARSAELTLRKREREIESKQQELELRVERQLESERAKIRSEALQQLQEQQQLKDAEKDKTISDLASRLKEMQRKVEQGSQQLQGEVLELALEELLRDSFTNDRIEPVAKGVCGGDNIHHVQTAGGRCCGSILWETKRTKNWSNAWLAKARDDQRNARAELVVIVSEALPDSVQTFDCIDGVWVCSWTCARALATALRHGLKEVAKSRVAQQGQDAKQALVYEYLSTSDFRQRMEGIVESLISMKHDLDAERRAFQRMWKKREQQIERGFTNIACLYGDFQGIVGASLPSVQGLELEVELIEDHSETMPTS